MYTNKTLTKVRVWDLPTRIFHWMLVAGVLGLGISTDGDILGLSPNNSDKPDDWNHR